MTDFQRCQPAATAPACPEKVAGLLTLHHLELIRAAQRALYAATAEAGTPADMAAWQAAAVRLAVALVSSLETIEEAPL